MEMKGNQNVALLMLELCSGEGCCDVEALGSKGTTCKP